MPRIFICYRRADSGMWAGRIRDRLVSYYGRGGVFQDVEDIGGGIPFSEAIAARIASADAVVVIIGPTWLSERLAEQDDPVRQEIAAALQRNARIIPVLVAGAAMPPTASLPTSIGSLGQINAVSITADRFTRDFADLIKALPKSRRRVIARIGLIASACAAIAVTTYTMMTGHGAILVPAQESVRSAWQVISAAQGKKGDLGRKAAMEVLVKRGVLVEGINLDSAWLEKANLAGVRASRASLRRADLEKADLRSADLRSAAANGVFLEEACLASADLSGANLEMAQLGGADLRGASLSFATLDGANLKLANLDSAYLHKTKLRYGAAPHGKAAAVTNLLKSLQSVPAFLRDSTMDSLRARATHAELPIDDRERIAESITDSTRSYIIRPAILHSASLRGATIEYAEMRDVVLDSADLTGVSIVYSDMRGASLQGIQGWNQLRSLKGSLLTGTESAPVGFFEEAIRKGASVLPPATDTTKLARLRGSVMRAEFILNTTSVPATDRGPNAAYGRRACEAGGKS